MATKKKVTSLPLAPALDNADVLHIVDVSDTTHGPAGSSKKTTIGDLVEKVQEGVSGADLSYSQAFNASVVVVNHNLGKKPSVVVTSSANEVVEGDIVHNSINQLTLTFNGSFVGTVFCN